MTELKRELGAFSCTMLVAGNMIGIGIFVTPGRISSQLPHPQLILLAWLFGGFLSLAGALSYAELGTRFPRAGGGYVYLRKSFGPFMGFLAGFSSSLVTIPGTAAFLAIGFTKYAGISDLFVSKIVAVSLILLISLVNYWGVKWGAELQDGFMLLKLTLIFVLIAAGFFSGRGSFHNFALSSALPQSVWIALPLVMVPIMYTYSGWDATVYVAGEVQEPARTIPVSLFFGTLLVTLVYLALAALYIYAIPVTSELGKETKIVREASRILFGATVGNIIGWLVAVSILGTLAATILTGPRIIYAMAKDGLFPSMASEVHPLFATPSKAILFQAVWSSILAVTGQFNQLLDYITVPSVLFAAVTVVGLFILRSKNLSDPESVPYFTWGYPVLPALFVLGMGWIVVNTILNDLTNSLWGLLIVLLGIPLYFFWKMFVRLVFHKPYAVAEEHELCEIPKEMVRKPDDKVVQAQKPALAALTQLCHAAQSEGISIIVLSAFRTFETQSALFQKAEQKHGKGQGIRWLAPPGFSEHHTGYVFDLADKNKTETDDEPSFEQTPAFRWLCEHAKDFGFELSFPKNNWQGVGYEPWHWRFVGEEKAKQLFRPHFLRWCCIALRAIWNSCRLKLS